jgi:hypothetical protein
VVVVVGGKASAAEMAANPLVGVTGEMAAVGATTTGRATEVAAIMVATTTRGAATRVAGPVQVLCAATSTETMTRSQTGASCSSSPPKVPAAIPPPPLPPPLQSVPQPHCPLQTQPCAPLSRRRPTPAATTPR